MQQSKTGFNSTTIPWSTPDLGQFDCDRVPQFDANRNDIQTYQQDGVVILRGVFSDWVEPLQNGFERNLTSPNDYRYPCESLPDGVPGRFFDSYCNWDLIPEYRDFVLNSFAASMAGQFMQSDSAQLFHEHTFLKEPGTQRATPWHQDLPYYCVDGNQTASIYIALDHADADVAVRFVKGSHKSGELYYPRVFMDGADFNNEESSISSVPDINNNLDDYDILTCSLGSVDVLHITD